MSPTRIAFPPARAPALAVAFIMAAALGCSRGDGTAAGPRAVPVRAVAAIEKDVPVELRAVGKIVSSQSVAIRPQVSGTLVRIHFTEGQAVKQGDLLVEIDRRPFEAALSEARARLAQDQVRAQNAREDAARYAGLVDKEFVTRQQHDAARANAAALEAQVAADQAALERAQLNLAYATIRAPISGRTGKLLVHAGNLVQAGAQEVVIGKGVAPGELVVTEGHLKLRPDAPVELLQDRGPSR